MPEQAAPPDNVVTTFRGTGANEAVRRTPRPAAQGLAGRSISGIRRKSPAQIMHANHAWQRKRAVNGLDHRGRHAHAKSP